jgi:hypothetical protein
MIPDMPEEWQFTSLFSSGGKKREYDEEWYCTEVNYSFVSNGISLYLMFCPYRMDLEIVVKNSNGLTILDLTFPECRCISIFEEDGFGHIDFKDSNKMRYRIQVYPFISFRHVRA